MKSRRSISSSVLSVVLLAALAPALTTPAMAKSAKAIEKVENDLLAAGFVDRPANTPERAAMLARLPANTFVRRVKDDNVHYVYADPKACSCLYVGSQQAYGQYLQTMQAKNLVDEQQFAAQEYSDANWNWGAWGGRWGRGWGFGPGLGW